MTEARAGAHSRHAVLSEMAGRDHVSTVPVVTLKLRRARSEAARARRRVGIPVDERQDRVPLSRRRVRVHRTKGRLRKLLIGHEADWEPDGQAEGRLDPSERRDGRQR
eukprot:scaffold152536_cov30-Tisochrysis_lutea.AAC.3